MTAYFDVLILGYGEMGHAMEHLLADRHNLYIWDKFVDAAPGSVVLEEAVPKADFILFCLPVNPHREIVTQIEPLLKDNCICLSIAKGLDETSLALRQEQRRQGQGQKQNANQVRHEGSGARFDARATVQSKHFCEHFPVAPKLL